MNNHYYVFCYSDYNKKVYSELGTVDNCEIIWDPASKEYGKVSYYRKRIIETLLGGCHFRINRPIERLLGIQRMGSPSAKPVLVLNEFSTLAKFPELLEEIKTIRPNIRTVLVLTNIIGSCPESSSYVVNDINNRSDFNCIITFDKQDAEKYGLNYYEGIYSPSTLEYEELKQLETGPQYDLYFCGMDKGRLPMLQRTYSRLSKLGLSCRFDIVTDRDEVLSDGMKLYSKQIPYKTIISRSYNAKAILELLAHPDSYGSTLRTFEAISLRKKLLTNNRYYTEKRWYNKKQFLGIDSPDKTLAEFISEPLKLEDSVDPGELSPKRFIQYIEDVI